MDKIGFKLVEMVKQDIKYKTDGATLKYQYTHVGCKCTIKTMYYKNPVDDIILTQLHPKQKSGL